MIDFKKRLILLELNEINFDIVEKYVAAKPSRFRALAKMLDGIRIRTISEEKYEELEPWIQWPSVHTEKTFSEHQIFRLGDVVDSKSPQIFERLEQAGYKVGAISAMNAENRLKNPSYFIPDPWTQTPTDSSWWSTVLSEAVSQAVNDNAKSKITKKSALIIILGFLRFAQFRNYAKYVKLTFQSAKKPWMKALVLDLLLHDIHLNLFKSKKANFSTLFLNAGAHIQHHYFFNAAPLRKEISQKNPEWYIQKDADPLADVLELYDLIVGEYYDTPGTELIIATGLSQKPYNHVKFYYRLRSHSDFLKNLGVDFINVIPRMTRDFLIEFKDNQSALFAEKLLGRITIETDGLPLFGELDNRGKTLFVTMTYPNEITADTTYVGHGNRHKLANEVDFVAIKNGMHQADGFAFFTSEVGRYAPKPMSHVCHLGSAIMNYFGGIR